MRKSRRAAVAAGLGLLTGAWAAGAPASGASSDGGRRLEVFTVSSPGGADHAVWVSRPAEADGPRPVVYILDGNRFFAPLLAHLAAPGAPETMRGAVFVGIGYASAQNSVIERRRLEDFSTPADLSSLSEQIRLLAPRLGGMAVFLSLLDTDIRRRVGEIVLIDPDCETLAGHSLAGLAVLHAALSSSTLDRFIAVSPSIWWNDREVMSGAALASPRRQNAVRLYIGAEEQTPRPDASVEAKARLARFRMIDNTLEMAGWLNAAAPGVARVEIVDGADHDSVALPALIRGLDRTLADCQA